ncbi:hypothetical protein [Elioraea sp.]|uniref:hypothetical protein n=1 Tax=Elioraea sp. TaxID=2185103 RepID=UPI00307DFAE4
MTGVRIERLRIVGLAGRAPARAEVEAALREALVRIAPSSSAEPPRRIAGGRTLAEAGAALARALGGKGEER